VWRRRLYFKVLIDGVIDLGLFFTCDWPISSWLLHGHLKRPFTVSAVTGMAKHGTPACRKKITNNKPV